MIRVRHVVVGPGTSMRAERAKLARLLEGTPFRLELVTGLDDSVLAERKSWPELHRTLQKAGLLTFAQFQHLTGLQLWRRLRELEPILRARRLPRASVLFSDICAYLAAERPDLHFRDHMSPADLLVSRNEWCSIYSADSTVADILTYNGVGGPKLLVKLYEEDIKGLWRCGEKQYPKVIALRNELQEGSQ